MGKALMAGPLKKDFILRLPLEEGDPCRQLSFGTGPDQKNVDYESGYEKVGSGYFFQIRIRVIFGSDSVLLRPCYIARLRMSEKENFRNNIIKIKRAESVYQYI